MRFTKMQGLGNDYVYVDCFNQPVPPRPDELARRISDRHFGVGSDGLILICPSRQVDVRMRMFNADGSESEMCGNGVRCLAKYVFEHGLCRKETLRVETGRGILTLKLQITPVDGAGGQVEQVSVDMGEPILEPARIPVHFPRPYDGDRIVNFPVERYIPISGGAAWMEDCGWDPRMTCISMGNPHVVLFPRFVESVPLESLGPFFERQPIFPQRINVHFVQVHNHCEVTVRTWERGSGITLACGTGACAVCVAGVLSGRTDRTILAHLPGGDLKLQWAEDGHVHMTGPAVEVFQGEWE